MNNKSITISGILLIMSNVFTLVPVYAQGTVQPSEFAYPSEIEPSQFAYPTETGENEFIYPTEEEVIDVRDTQISEINGEILKMENDLLTLETNEGTKEINITQEIAIKRNSMEANIEDIKPGDKASIKINENGEVISMDITSESVMETGKLLMIILPLAAVVILFILSILKKANKPHIKTTSE